MFSFRQVDVFADRPTEGNPVAVVHDADDLTDEPMQRSPQWTNLSRDDVPPAARPTPRADYRLRIFTPSRELPFAGHPTLGQRARLARGGRDAARRGTLVQECAAGLVAIRRDGAERLAFAAPPLLRYGPSTTLTLTTIAEASGSPRRHRRRQVGRQRAGLGRRPAARRPRPSWPSSPTASCSTASTSASSARGPTALGRRRRGACVRPDLGTGEDPVTGSLNASLGQWLLGTGPPRRPTSRPRAPRRPTRPGAREAVRADALGGRRHPHHGAWRGGHLTGCPGSAQVRWLALAVLPSNQRAESVLRRLRRPAAALCAVLLVSALAACGDDKDKAADPTPSRSPRSRRRLRRALGAASAS